MWRTWLRVPATVRSASYRENYSPGAHRDAARMYESCVTWVSNRKFASKRVSDEPLSGTWRRVCLYEPREDVAVRELQPDRRRLGRQRAGRAMPDLRNPRSAVDSCPRVSPAGQYDGAHRNPSR